MASKCSSGRSGRRPAVEKKQRRRRIVFFRIQLNYYRGKTICLNHVRKDMISMLYYKIHYMGSGEGSWRHQGPEQFDEINGNCKLRFEK